MAFVVKDRVQETCLSPGTGTVTLLGASTGYQTFSAAIGNGNTTYYAIADQSGANWEVGLGTYSSSGNTLARTTVLASSNAGSLVNFSSGTQNVWVDYPAGKSVYLDSSGNLVITNSITGAQVTASNGLFLNPNVISANTTVPAGYNAQSAGPISIATGVTVTLATGSRWVIN